MNRYDRDVIPLPAAPPLPIDRIEAPRILIVEDDEVDYRATRRMLAKIFGEALALDWARTWEEAVAKIEDGGYDIYLVDYSLGAHTGIDLMRQIADDARRAFIFLTGHEDRDRDLAATTAGAADFLVKGEITPARLERSIRYAIAMNATQRTLQQQADELRRAHALVQDQAERYLRQAQELAVAQREIRLALQRAEESERRYRALAERDVLTGLANRSVLQARMQEAIARTRRSGGVLALLILDLDRFKKVNDTLGHAVGDQLIIAVGERLTALVRGSDLVVRLGGDEFAVMLSDMQAQSNAASVANKILASLEQPFVIDGKEVSTRTSIGIALLDDTFETVDTMLKKADTALYKAKAQGRGTFRYFDEGLEREVRRRVRLEADLPAALAEDQLFLEYQPQVTLETGAVTAVEALVRWQHPTLGRIDPEEFIPLAEATRQIVPLTRWVLRHACAEAVRWREGLAEPVPVVANVTALDIAEEDFAETVSGILSQAGLAPALLQLEVTESSALNLTETMAEQLRRLGRRGVKVAIDDFGIGYSSFVHTRVLPVSKIKVDRTFVANMLADRRDAAVVHAVVTLARCMGVGAVVEGVETEEQRDYLRSMGDLDMQGHLVSLPLDGVAMLDWLQSRPAGKA